MTDPTHLAREKAVAVQTGLSPSLYARFVQYMKATGYTKQSDALRSIVIERLKAEGL
ncbi:hypothetical protein [Hymenobacter koreensis]|uniref:CopG family transcriptional regulator n=1 Tax=Hymenobacter koreensis TaxID=1084523 RepID=A0ABP8JJN7_9BACT